MRSRGNMGYGYEVGLWGEVREEDTFTCQHCNKITSVKAYERPEDAGGMCGVCAGLICKECHAKRECLPLEKWLDMIENPHKQHGKIHGGWTKLPVKAKPSDLM